MSKRRIFRRRQIALTLVAEGVPVVEVARRLRCARSAIYYWLGKSPDDGTTAAPVGTPTGRPPRRLVAAHEARVEAMQEANVEVEQTVDVETKREAEVLAKQELEFVDKVRLASVLHDCFFSSTPRSRQIASAVWPADEPLPEHWTPELKQEQLEKRTGKAYRPDVAAEMIRQLEELWKELGTRKR